MKKLFILAGQLVVLVFSFCTPASERFTISARVSDVSEGTVFYLANTRDNFLIDSCYLRNGNLFFEGKLSRVENLLLHATDKVSKEFIYTLLVMGNDNVVFNASQKDFPWNIDASGSEDQDVAEKFNQVEYQRQKLKASMNEKVSGISGLDQLKVELIKKYFNTYAALINFKIYRLNFQTEELNALYEGLSPELKESVYGGAIKKQIEYPPAIVGGPYYDYTAVDQNGDTISLSDIGNKYILLHFSSSACYASQQALPEMKTLYHRLKDKLEIVKLSGDASIKTWQASIRQDSIPWLNLWDGEGDYGDAIIKYGVIGTPNFVLISPDKTIVDKWFGYEEGLIEEKIEEHL